MLLAVRLRPMKPGYRRTELLDDRQLATYTTPSVACLLGTGHSLPQIWVSKRIWLVKATHKPTTTRIALPIKLGHDSVHYLTNSEQARRVTSLFSLTLKRHLVVFSVRMPKPRLPLQATSVRGLVSGIKSSATEST